MYSFEGTALQVAIRCDALASAGTGHLIRQTALVEELRSRGHRATLYGHCDVPWAREQAARVGLEFVPPEPDFAAQVEAAGTDVVVIDGYGIPAQTGASLCAAGIPVAAMVDGEFGTHQPADLRVDQNLGSPDPGGEDWLVGPAYVLLRDVVLTRRDAPRQANDPVRVLVVFGGSDPFGGCPVAAGLLLSTGLPMHVVAVAANPERVDELAELSPGQRQSLEVVGPQDDLPGLAMTCDLVVSAAGSSTWEFACLGIPTGLVCVVDNQLIAYQAATADLAVGIGQLEPLRGDEDARDQARDALARLVADPEWRARLAEGGRRIVDGEGRKRVVDALERITP